MNNQFRNKTANSKPEIWDESANIASVSGGVIVSTMAPFDNKGALLTETIASQAQRIARIDGVYGIAVNTVSIERRSLTKEERLCVASHTAGVLQSGQIALAGVDCTYDIREEVFALRTAGVSAVIVGLPQANSHDCSIKTLVEFASIIDELSLPVVISLGIGGAKSSIRGDQLVALIERCPRILAVGIGADDDVLGYDHDYYALKNAIQPIACLPSSVGALFHNLNTGADGVLSSLAYVAPHEVIALYQAAREGNFPLAQAIHNKLAPLAHLIARQNDNLRDHLFRHIAHYRGLLPSTAMPGGCEAVGAHFKSDIHQTLNKIKLRPIANA